MKEKSLNLVLGEEPDMSDVVDDKSKFVKVSALKKIKQLRAEESKIKKLRDKLTSLVIQAVTEGDAYLPKSYGRIDIRSTTAWKKVALLLAGGDENKCSQIAEDNGFISEYPVLTITNEVFENA